MSDPEAILFDLDGVIIDSEPLSEKAFRQTSLHLGRDLTQEEVASLKGTVEEIGAGKLLEYNPAATLSVPQVSFREESGRRDSLRARREKVFSPAKMIRRRSSFSKERDISTTKNGATLR